MTRSPAVGYEPVCRVTDVPLEGGVAALVRGEAVALFRTGDGEVLALSNYDPVARASVLSRGILGTRTTGSGPDAREVWFVASPMHKQAYDLRTGQCLDDAALRVRAYDVAVSDGTVLVGPAREEGP